MGRSTCPKTWALHIDAALGGKSCGCAVATSSADITIECVGKTINCIAHTHCVPPWGRLHIGIQKASVADIATDSDTDTAGGRLVG